MPRDGSGTYSQPAGTSAVLGQTIDPDKFNTLISDLGSEITASLPVAGEKAMSGALAMAGNKITGMASGSPATATDGATIGNVLPTVLAKTANYSVVASDVGRLLTGDATGGSFTFTAPAVAGIPSGTRYRFIKIDSSANTVTVDGNGSEQINGALTVVLASQYDSVSIETNGTAWYIVPSVPPTVANLSITAANLSGSVALSGVISPTALSTDQNDYSPTSLSIASELRLNVTGDCLITGLALGAAGRVITLVNIGTNRVTLKNASASSTAANRFQFGHDISLDTDDTLVIKYDATTSRWRRFATEYASAIGPPPMGVLTLTSGTPSMTAGYGTGESNAATSSVFYTQDVGGHLPVPDGSGAFCWLPFTEQTLTLNASHVAQGVYDVIGYKTAAGRVAIATGPAWSVAGNYVSSTTLTTGTAARGTGAASAELSRSTTYGFRVNAVDFAYRNGATTGTVLAGQAIWLGTIWIDAAAGALTCQMLIGQSRKWGLYNAFGRRDRSLLVGDSTAGWSGTSVLRALRGQTANSGSILSGLGEEIVRARTMFTYNCAVNGNSANSSVGIASITVSSGFRGVSGVASGTPSPIATANGEHRLTPFLGTQAFTHMEQADNGTVSAAAAPSGNLMVIDFKA